MTTNNSDTPSQVALTLENISKRYGSVVALNDISFELKRGEFLTMLGPSGSGKTTALRVIAGFLRPDSGRVVLHGRDVVDVAPNKRNIGMLFQDYALFPHMTAGANVGFPLETRGIALSERRRRVTEMLDVVGLSNFEDRLPKQLSGGQQQRVALARALIFNPEIVLLDEPMAALDKKLRTSMQLEILRIAKSVGATVISVTHVQEEALVMSDRIALFSRGELAQIGTPFELYQRPVTKFVADFIGDANVLSGLAEYTAQQTVVTGAGWRAVLPPSPRLPARSADLSIVVRPEAIRVNPGAGRDASACAVGTVTEKIYLGVEYKLFIELTHGQCVNVRSRDMRQMSTIQPGDAVDLNWDADDVVVIRNENSK